MTASSGDRRKLALLIGIDAYPHVQRLRGGVNDARLMAGILQRAYGFSSNAVNLLLDGEATRAKIVHAVRQMVDTATSGDIVVIFYSGQGARVPASRKPDERRVSAILPYDSAPVQPGSGPGPGNDIDAAIVYDEIAGWLQRLTRATPYVTVILDANFAAPPLPEESAPGGSPYVFLGACRPEEQAYEYFVQGIHHGVFTYSLGQALLDADAGATYRDVFQRVSAQVMKLFPNQHPQLDGASDYQVFGGRNAQPMRFVPVLQRRQSKALLGAGAADGLTTGSEWAIYPPGTTHPSGEMSRLGLVTVSSVGASEAEARILSEARSRGIIKGALALEERHNFGEMRMAIRVQSPGDAEAPGREMSRLIAESQLLRLVEAGEFAPVTLCLAPPRREVKAGDPAPALGPLAEAVWVVVDDLGRPLMPVYAASSRSALWDTRAGLEKIARYRNVLGLRNPNLNSILRDAVTLDLLQMSEGRWRPAAPDDDVGVPVFAEGERVAFRVANQHDAPVYISVLDFGLTGDIALVHALHGASQCLSAGAAVVVGAQDDDRLTVYIPEDFPRTPGAKGRKLVEAIETLKLFATTYQTDFSRLILQDGIRGSSGAAGVMGEQTVAWQLLDMALTGFGARGVRLVNLPPEQEWTTVERLFAVRRRNGGA